MGGENQPPRTFLAVDEINLPEGERLSSQVRIRWWGDDPDGYVDGYEFCQGDFAGCEWTNAGMTTDTILVLPIPQGNDYADVEFTVRAYDNEGLRDPVGASTTFPIKNSPPDLALITADLPSDTTYGIMSFGWEASDPDGEENLNYIEFTVNDTSNTWIQVDPDISYLTLDISDDSMNEAEARIYVGRALSTTELVINGLKINARNTLYIRSVDQALAKSPVQEVEWHVKRQNSNILVVNDNTLMNSESILNEHLGYLRQLGFDNIDYLDLSNTHHPERTHLNTTQNETLIRQFQRWDHVYWVSDSFTRRIQFASRFLTGFFDNGGTMFVSSPTGNYSDQNATVQFLPISHMRPLPEGANNYQIGRNAVIKPANSNTGLTELIRNLTSLDRNSMPIVPLGDATVLYEAPYTDSNNYFGEPYYLPIAVLSNERNLGFFGMDLTILTEEEDLIDALDYILKQQLNFELR